jgi:hypothetical protein
VPEAPDASSQYERLTGGSTGGHCGYGGEVVGFQRVLHTDQATKQQQSVVFHSYPSRLPLNLALNLAATE